MSRLIAIDPGSGKCGLVLADAQEGIVLEGIVVEKSAVLDQIASWLYQSTVEIILLGNGTSSKYWERMIKELAPVKLVEERGTTLRARSRYWELWPPTGWQRFMPKGLILPSQPLDSVAALVLLEDRIQKKLSWPSLPDFKIEP